MGAIYNYYYIVLILQGICAFHSFKRGTQNKWLWIIVFFPLIGCLIYIFSEIVKKQDVTSVQSSLTTIVNPTGKIKKLEKELEFANTFENKIALADAYFEMKMYEKAFELYEPSLTGIFKDNEHVIKKLIELYSLAGKTDKVVELGARVSNALNFAKHPACLCYAVALEQTGKFDQAEVFFKKMNMRFSNFEARYIYANLLAKHGKKDEAAAIFKQMLNDGEQMNRREIGDSRPWIDKAQQELNNLRVS